MSLRPDDPLVLRAATAALNQLSNRDQELLELVLVEGGSPDSIAVTKQLPRDQIKAQLREAWQQFADRLAFQLERLGVSRGDTQALMLISDQVGAGAYRLRMTTFESNISDPEPPPAAVACPSCGARFQDRGGQFGAYAKLAAEGRIGLMIGCTACSRLFVP